jgi:hypothetical protein
MNRKPVSTIIGTACLLFSCITGCATMAAKDNAPTDLMIIDRWGGDFGRPAGSVARQRWYRLHG